MVLSRAAHQAANMGILGFNRLSMVTGFHLSHDITIALAVNSTLFVLILFEYRLTCLSANAALVHTCCRVVCDGARWQEMST